MISGPSVPPRAGGKAQSVIIFLHGLGDSGAGLIDLAAPFGDALPHTAFHSPDGPEPYAMGPFGRQWFGLQDWSQQAIYDGAVRAAPFLHAFIDAQLATYDLPPSQLALFGFSQGCMMALHVGLRRTQPLGALLGYSGGLVGPERLASEIKSRPPVLLVHGMMDTVVPYAAMPASAQYLRSAGITVTTETRPMLGHGIDDEGLLRGARFTAQYLHSTTV